MPLAQSERLGKIYRRIKSIEGQILDNVQPFVGVGGASDEFQVSDHCADSKLHGHDDDASDGGPSGDLIGGRVGQRLSVVGQQHEALNGRPFQNRGIVGASESSMLNRYYFDGRNSMLETSNDVVVEILVGCESDQRLRRA